MCKLGLLRITRFKYKRKNQKHSGRGRKVVQSRKWPFGKAIHSRPGCKKVDFFLRNVFSIKVRSASRPFSASFQTFCLIVRRYLTTQTEYGVRCSLIVGCYERLEKVGKTIAHVSIVYILTTVKTRV